MSDEIRRVMAATFARALVKLTDEERERRRDESALVVEGEPSDEQEAA